MCTHLHVSFGVSLMLKEPLNRAGPTPGAAGVRCHIPPKSILEGTIYMYIDYIITSTGQVHTAPHTVNTCTYHRTPIVYRPSFKSTMNNSHMKTQVCIFTHLDRDLRLTCKIDYLPFHITIYTHTHTLIHISLVKKKTWFEFKRIDFPVLVLFAIDFYRARYTCVRKRERKVEWRDSKKIIREGQTIRCEQRLEEVGERELNRYVVTKTRLHWPFLASSEWS